MKFKKIIIHIETPNSITSISNFNGLVFVDDFHELYLYATLYINIIMYKNIRRQVSYLIHYIHIIMVQWFTLTFRVGAQREQYYLSNNRKLLTFDYTLVYWYIRAELHYITENISSIRYRTIVWNMKINISTSGKLSNCNSIKEFYSYCEKKYRWKLFDVDFILKIDIT